MFKCLYSETDVGIKQVNN